MHIQIGVTKLTADLQSFHIKRSSEPVIIIFPEKTIENKSYHNHLVPEIAIISPFVSLSCLYLINMINNLKCLCKASSNQATF